MTKDSGRFRGSKLGISLLADSSAPLSEEPILAVHRDLEKTESSNLPFYLELLFYEHCSQRMALLDGILDEFLNILEYRVQMSVDDWIHL